jgi:hypothetical protein
MRINSRRAPQLDAEPPLLLENVKRVASVTSPCDLPTGGINPQCLGLLSRPCCA